MQFNSLSFIFLFLPVSLLLFFIWKRKWKRRNLLLFLSLAFYFLIGGTQIIVLLLTTFFTFIFARFIEFQKGKTIAKRILVFAISMNVISLLYFKYSGFIFSNLGIGSKFAVEVDLPSGISFFTFVSISYLLDVYFNRIEVLNSFCEVGFLITFFPKVLNGPITLAYQTIGNIRKEIVDSYYISDGIKRFIIGLAKKVLIADTIANVVDKIFMIPGNLLNPEVSWMGILLYSLQIYYDFSGYTDMAIGLALMFGYKLPENFNYPYISKSISDFWRRWHITLGKWLQVYLFLPIAFSISRKIKSPFVLKIRAESWAYIISSFFTMLICGIWHGAKWTFILWGIYHGLFLILEHLKLKRFLKKQESWVGILYSLIVIMFGWVIFRSESLPYAIKYMSAMLGMGSWDSSHYYFSLFMNNKLWIVTLIALFGSFPIQKKIEFQINEFFSCLSINSCKYFKMVYNISILFFYIVVFLLSLLHISSGSFNPFLYGRF